MKIKSKNQVLRDDLRVSAHYMGSQFLFSQAQFSYALQQSSADTPPAVDESPVSLVRCFDAGAGNWATVAVLSIIHAMMIKVAAVCRSSGLAAVFQSKIANLGAPTRRLTCLRSGLDSRPCIVVIVRRLQREIRWAETGRRTPLGWICHSRVRKATLLAGSRGARTPL
jgi:hypothetical protein